MSVARPGASLIRNAVLARTSVDGSRLVSFVAARVEEAAPAPCEFAETNQPLPTTTPNTRSVRTFMVSLIGYKSYTIRKNQLA